MPAWERHDFATCAARLPGVRRLERGFIVLLSCAVGSIALPLILGLIKAPRLLMNLTPFVVVALLASAFVLKGRSRQVQQLAIARWVAAGDP